MERRLVRRSPWGSVVSQKQNCKDNEDQDAQGCNQECHPPPRLWITCDHGLVTREGATRKSRAPRSSDKLYLRRVDAKPREQVGANKSLDDEQSGHRLKSPVLNVDRDRPSDPRNPNASASVFDVEIDRMHHSPTLNR
jgi:hypothetical protein